MSRGIVSHLTGIVCSLGIVIAMCGDIAGQNTIRGAVYSSADGSELIGANVMIKGTATGVNTD